ncbi:hypothetical protein [Spongiactinospora sp. TRM90649]|nr:hypothetical protein [Spongiactinospora sp. TRM90649]MDF5753230.1 hypothetical protein [Spongiactinospora sp. TRM90649]
MRTITDAPVPVAAGIEFELEQLATRLGASEPEVSCAGCTGCKA